ncbi:MATE family efflux transporter [Treponema sp.]|jgi:putative MATE family efflux protein|uniref:MATE family efflux transporter n=1 Tax=Treponema sp. TaxID=166 RepID=UPI00257C0880|nr:MATE family efflux transporter [Treponema sp.]MBE6354243.1 MATE family efflux transporter [Treponema sp.]
MNKKELLFSRKDLWHLIWPLLVEQILNNTLGIADILMVASKGEAAAAGVSLVDQINILLVQIFAALSTGGAVVCSQYIGARNQKMANNTARQLIITVFFIALFFMVFGLLFSSTILTGIFGNVDYSVMQASRTYFLITLLALPSIALYNAASSLFRAQGNSRISMMIALLINVINIGGNAVMIYGMGAGVEGVAVPTFISRTAAAVVLIFLLYIKKTYDGKESVNIKGILKTLPDFTIIRRILKIGVPNGIESSAFQIGKLLVLGLTASYGTAAIAANAASNTIASFQVLPGTAMGFALLTVAGQCMGAGKPEQAQYYTKRIMLVCYAFMWLLNIPMLAFLRPIAGLFNMSEHTTDLAYLFVFFHGTCAMLIWPLSFSLPNVLRAAGDAAYTMIICMISMWTVRVGAAYLFKYTDNFGLCSYFGVSSDYGAFGIWVAMILDWIIRSAFFTVHYARGKWKSRRVI